MIVIPRWLGLRILLARLFAGAAAFGAAHRIVQETFLRIEFLLSGSKDKLFSTITTG
jgi:hypothetical protein